jgi:hypothetical protein
LSSRTDEAHENKSSEPPGRRHSPVAEPGQKQRVVRARYSGRSEKQPAQSAQD